MTAILDLILGPLGGILAALGGMAILYIKGRSDGASKTENKRHEQDAKARDRGRDAVQAGRDGGKSPADRLRDNDGEW